MGKPKSTLAPISTNLYDGSNWLYPDADYPRRDSIWNDHLQYTHGLLYFISHDPSVPETIRREAAEWGLCKDEFADTGYWPHQLYVRVARRMVGEYVLTQHDLLRDTLKYDGIGMGSYNIHVRHIQRTYQWISRFPELRGETFNEGMLPTPVLPATRFRTGPCYRVTNSAPTCWYPFVFPARIWRTASFCKWSPST